MPKHINALYKFVIKISIAFRRKDMKFKKILSSFLAFAVAFGAVSFAPLGNNGSFLNSAIVAEAKTENSSPILYSVNSYDLSNRHEHTYTCAVTRQPTCSAPGIKTYTCKTCGDEWTESISKLAHIQNIEIRRQKCQTLFRLEQGKGCHNQIVIKITNN